jgi:hypothetical protein
MLQRPTDVFGEEVIVHSFLEPLSALVHALDRGEFSTPSECLGRGQIAVDATQYSDRLASFVWGPVFE